MKSKLLSVVAVSLALACPAFSQHIAGTTTLGPYSLRGEGITNAVNPATNTIYVSDSMSPTVVTVISGSTHAITATITVGSGGAVLAVNSSTNTIYALNGDQTISVINGANNEVTATIPPLTSDNCLTNIVADPSNNEVAVIDECDSSVYLLDGSSYALLTTVNDGLQYAETAAVNPVTNLLYITGDNDHAYSVVDLTAYTSTTVSLGSDEPYGVAVDTTLNRIYIGDDVFERMYVFDGATNSLFTTVALTYNAMGFAVNQNTHIFGVSDGDHSLYFYHGFSLAADGQLSYSPQPSFLNNLSNNSNNNLFYIGASPGNTLVFVVGPTS